MAIPWICYSPIEVSPDSYALVLKDRVQAMRLCEFDKVLHGLEQIANDTECSNEARSLAHYVLSETLLRQYTKQSVEQAINHAKKSRELFSDNLELVLASYYVQGQGLQDVGNNDAAAKCYRESLAVGDPCRATSLRWVINARSLAYLVFGSPEAITLLDSIISSGTPWREEVVDAYCIKLGCLQLSEKKAMLEGKASEKGDKLYREIMSNSEAQRIHYDEQLQYGLKCYLLYDYESAIELFSEVIESLQSNPAGIDDMKLLRAYVGRGDSCQAIERDDLAEADYSKAKDLVKSIYEEVDRYSSNCYDSWWQHVVFECRIHFRKFFPRLFRKK